MLARNGDGEWRVLEPLVELPPGGFVTMCGTDLAPVLGYDRPLLVAATEPALDGAPDAICVTPRGDIVLVVSFFEQSHESALFRLLECAGALQSMDYGSFLAVCDRVSDHASLSDWVESLVDDAELAPAALELTVAESLRKGRFMMIAVVPDSNDRLTRPLRYLNSHGSASIFCYELAPFSAGSVQCIDAFHVDVGAREPEPVTLELSGSVLVTSAAKSHGSEQATLVAQLVDFVEQRFPTVTFTGDLGQVRLEASIDSGRGSQTCLLALDSDGQVTLELAELAPAVRVQLVHGIGRVLGRNLGDPFNVASEQLRIDEHLNDQTLMAFFIETLTEALDTMPGEQQQRRGEQEPRGVELDDDRSEAGHTTDQEGEPSYGPGDSMLEFDDSDRFGPNIVPARLQAL